MTNPAKTPRGPHILGIDLSSKARATSRSEDRHKAMQLVQPLMQTPEFHVVVIPGDPCSKARPRFVNGGRPYTPKKTIEGEKRIAAALVHLGPFKGNVAVACVFRRATYQRIDIDNLLKAVLDGGTRAGIWEDDSQVTALIGILEHDREDPRTVICFAEHASTLGRGENALATCEGCGNRFKPTGNQRRDRARWCSRTCRTYLAEPVECPSCHEPFKRRSANQKYCSNTCRGAGQSQRARDITTPQRRERK